MTFNSVLIAMSIAWLVGVVCGIMFMAGYKMELRDRETKRRRRGK